MSDANTIATVVPILSNQAPPTPPANSTTKEPNSFIRLVRSISRSSPRSSTSNTTTSKSHGRKSSTSQSQSLQQSQGYSPSLATSPPPDSYFPPPPVDTLNSNEASGRSRDPESSGARATDIGSSHIGFSAPGVSFAPSSANRDGKVSDQELESWVPAPRRSVSQRAQRVKSIDGKSSGRGDGSKEGPPISSRTGLSRARAASNGQQSLSSNSNNNNNNESGSSSNNSSGEAINGNSPTNGVASGERRGVQLEDTVLSRKTSGVKRSLTAVRRAVERSGIFTPTLKVEGEKRCLILVADGSEEIEVFTPFDIFVRASLNPTIVSVSPLFSPSQSLPYITLSRGARILADTQFETLKQEHKDDFDAIIIPGGAKGAERLSQDPEVQKLIWQFHEEGKLIGVICAGALAAKTSGIAAGKKITSHPSVRDQLEKHYIYSEDAVVISDNLVSSRGPATSLAFSLAIVEILAGKAKRDEVALPLMMADSTI